MQDVKQAQKAHVLVVPYPGQGHINPMLQFAKRLASKGIKPTLTPTIYMVKSMQLFDIPTQTGLPIQIRPISDGFDDGGKNQAGSTSTYLDSLNIHGPKTLAQLIKKLAEDGDPVKAVIYDGFLPWALDVGKKFGLIGVCFFTQSCTVNSVYYHVQRGLIQLPLSGQDTVSIPGAPKLQPRDLPSFVEKYGSYPFWFRVVVEQFSNIDQADWVLCNIFYDMEKEVVDWMSTMWKIRTIGPTTPSHYLDKTLKDDKDYNLQLFKPNKELTKKWLDTKPTNSVIYISFGSAAILSELQFKELSQGLKNSQRSFLWVVRELEHSKLPKGFLEETSNQGLVVSWASQLEILAHKATCCFVTHCGFNSILEALSLGVVVVGYPQYTDQGTNAKFVEDVWGVGIRAKVDEEGVVRREEVEEFIRVVMEGKKRDEMMKNVGKWKKLAKEAMEEGGSSCKNIDEFVAYLGLVVVRVYGRKEVEEFIRVVMEGKKRDEMMKNVGKWKKLAKEAMEEGGSSCKNIDEFVAYLGLVVVRVYGRKEVEEFIRVVMEGKKRDEMMKNVGKWKKLAKEALEEGESSCKNIDEFVTYLGGC